MAIPPTVRYIVRIGDDWTVTPLCPEHDAEWLSFWKTQPRQMSKLKDAAGRTFPAGSLSGAAVTAASPGDDIAAISAAYTSIIDRTEPQIEAFGKYLFGALLGQDLWAAMTQFAESKDTDSLELALAVPPRDADLHRLPWELMRSPSNFVAAGVWNGPIRKLSVAITRLVEGHDDVKLPAEAPPIPKVLYVVGTDLNDEQIRPGAELVSFLRRLPTDRPIRRLLLERATIHMIGEAAASFDPDVVHFICHGGISETGKPFLDLRMDQGQEDPHRTPGQLLEALSKAGRKPTVVVLSACYTSSASGREEFVPAGAETVAPMATQFVEGGVPIVIGMSGRVSDMTCRLFTRTFGQSMVMGEPVVRATALARMATFVEGRDPLASPDWALPTVFLASGVGPDAAPFTAQAAGEQLLRVEQWITNMGLRDQPVFSGREAFFGWVRDMLRGHSETGPVSPGLAVFVADKGLGASRLLKELAIAGLQDGHLPVRVAPPAERPPTTLEAFIRDLAIAIATHPVCPAAKKLQLGLLLDWKPDAASDPVGLDNAIGLMLGLDREIRPRTVYEAAQRDLADLLQRATEVDPRFGASTSRAVVFLDDVDLYGTELIKQLTSEQDGIITQSGLGTAANPVPVVLVFHVNDSTLPLVGSPSEPRFANKVLAPMKLSPFEPNEEMLACNLILLNPYLPPSAESNFPSKAWAFVDLDRDAYTELSEAFRFNLKGIPKKLAGPDLYGAAIVAKSGGRLKEADDVDLLEKVRKASRGP